MGDKAGRDWSNGLCSCSSVSTCLTSWCCPCFVYGKTEARLKDPSLSHFSNCNGSCCGWLCLSCLGLPCILTFMQRNKIRDTYGIEGSGFKDFCAGLCCTCCVLVQNSNESVARTQQTGAYQSPPAMAYP